MNFEIIQASYYINAEPVTIVTKNIFGGLTSIETSQSELNAARTDVNAPWSDDELQAVALERLPLLFPGVQGITVSLYVPPATPAPPPAEEIEP